MNVSEARAAVAAADEQELLDRVLAEIGQVVGPDVSEARRENPARGIMIAAPIACGPSPWRSTTYGCRS